MQLFEARARKRVTQWDLTFKTGIHQSKISLMERGYVEPSVEEKGKIANALGLKMADIKWPSEIIARRRCNE